MHFFASATGALAARCGVEVDALHADEAARGVGHPGDEAGELAEDVAVVRVAVVEARVEAERRVPACANRPRVQIGLRRGAVDGPAHRPEPARRLGASVRVAAAIRALGHRRRRVAEEGLRLGHRGSHAGIAALAAQQLEQVAALAGGGIAPPPRRARGAETHIHRAPGIAVDVPDHPVPPGLAPAGQIRPTHRLGPRGKGCGERSCATAVRSAPWIRHVLILPC